MNIMMPGEDVIEIESFLKSRNIENMLEIGSGGSTLHFSKYVKNYYSIEHDESWLEDVERWVNKEKISNVKMILRQKNKIPEFDIAEPIIAESWEELDHSSRSKEYKDYIQAPLDFGVLFDVVLVDGRARPECFKFLCENDLINKPGTIFVHDYRALDHPLSRKHYNVIEGKYTPTWIKNNGSGLAYFEFR
jgi:hypothetical protein